LTPLRAALAALALLAAGGAQAQRALPQDRVPEEQRAQFRLCRAAIIYHLDGPEDRSATVPRAMARAMNEQMSFVMFESIKSAPAGDLAQTREALVFVERFFLDLARTIGEQRDRLADLRERERILLDCQVLIWRAMSDYIDYLMRWRERAADAPPPLDR